MKKLSQAEQNRLELSQIPKSLRGRIFVNKLELHFPTHPQDDRISFDRIPHSNFRNLAPFITGNCIIIDSQLHEDHFEIWSIFKFINGQFFECSVHDSKGYLENPKGFRNDTNMCREFTRILYEVKERSF